MSLVQIREEVSLSLRQGRPVVALESTVIAHGLPWPVNLEMARAMEAAVREEGATPATIAVWQGQPVIGLSDEQLAELAQEPDVLKASRRELGIAIASGRTAATTVAGTMFLAHRAGIRVCATGGIGGAHPDTRGAHPDTGQAWDISADLAELARTPVAVVCAGAKSIVDISRTLEILETSGVPVLGYGTDTFPAFYLRTSREPVTARLDTPEQVAGVLRAHWQLDGAGVVIAQPIVPEAALQERSFREALREVEEEAMLLQIRGQQLTPFLLKGLARATRGKALQANQTLLLANARLAAQIAIALGPLVNATLS
jgi:pseudouridine-5'-phosphate glycosidase